MSAPSNQPRKLLLINPPFQFKFLVYSVGTTALALVIFYVSNALFFWRFKSMGHQIGLPEGHVFFQFIDEQRSVMMAVFLLTAAVLLITLSIAGLLFSHRIAGPLYRLKKHLDSIGSGSPTASEVHFREGDYFPELATAANQAITRLRNGG